MKTLNQKIEKALEKEFNLNGYEVRNAVAVANRRNGIKTAVIESWYAAVDRKFVLDHGFLSVECHMMDNATGERLDDVIVECCMFDRRMSFIRKTIKEIEAADKKAEAKPVRLKAGFGLLI